MSTMTARRTTGLALVAATVAAGLASLPVAATADQAGCPWVGSSASPDQRAGQVLAQMTTAEKLSIVHGAANPYAGQFTGPVYAGEVPAIARLCIPQLGLLDGPAGVGDGFTGVTQLPDPTALAAAWDPALASQYGQLIGTEDAGKGANVALGPTLDEVRDPRAGRAFETMGEDPYLTSALAVPEIQGIQGQGVIAQAKHLAVYNQETLRDTPADNAVVDERTLQEIYLPAFDAAVQGGVGSVMCGYSYVNGVQDCNNSYLMNQVLDGQFGFTGFTTSDWFAMHASVAAANAGLDLQMPDACYFGSRLSLALSTGAVSGARLDDMVRRILRTEFQAGLFDRPATGTPDTPVTSQAHADVARTVAEQGTVLLKNSGPLPLDTAREHSIAVIGTDAGAGTFGSGGGSAHVIAPAIVTPYQGIARRAGSAATVSYDSGADPARAAATAAAAQVAVVFVNLQDTEAKDQTGIDLSDQDNQLIERVAAANPNTVVVLHTGSAVTMPWLGQVAGVLEGWYPGQQDGDAIAAVLFGDVDPAGKLPVTFPAALGQVPASSPQRFPGVAGTVSYGEGLDVGYRWYDQQNLTPLFPFGYGLSYTTFAMHDLTVGQPDAQGRVTVTAQVTNTGSRAGAEVAQLYLGHPAGDDEPPRQLQAFDKVALGPGQTGTATFTLTARSFSHWDVGTHQWQAGAGSYQVSVGDSSRDLPLTGNVTLASGRPTSAATPPAPAGAPSAGDNAADGALNALVCPTDYALPTVNGVISLFGLPSATQATNPPQDPSSTGN